MRPLNWNDDDDLIRDIADALRPDPLEQRVVEAARVAYGWWSCDPDLEIAALLYDSYVDGGVVVRARHAGPPRTLLFGCGPLRVEIEVSRAGIDGQLIPPGPGTVRLLTVSGPVAETTADEVGCFTLPSPPTGPMRIECTVSGGRFATKWVVA
jgi:hypothetical protein